MIAPEFYIHGDGKFSAVHLSMVRQPFEWKVDETVEIPLSLVTEVCDENVYNICRTLYPPHRTGVVSMMSWFSGLPPHKHVCVELFFFHRELQHRVLSYEKAERKYSISCDEALYSP